MTWERGWGGSKGLESDVGPTAVARLPATFFLQNKMNVKGTGLFHLIGLPIG